MIRRQAWDEFRVAVTSLKAADVSELIIDLPPESEAIVFRVLPKDRVAMVFSYLSIDQQEKLVRSLSTEQVCFIVEQLKPDDRERLFEELPADATRRLLGALSLDQLKATCELLGYPPPQVRGQVHDASVCCTPRESVRVRIDRLRSP